MSNLKQHYEKMEKSAKTSNKPTPQLNTSTNANMSLMTINTASGHDKHLKKVVYVAPEKHRVSLTEHRHVTGGTTVPKPNE